MLRQVLPNTFATEAGIPAWGSLLRDAGIATLEEFSADVHDNEEVDTWIRPTSTGVLIETTTGGIALDFPFTWADFWSVVEEVAEDFLAADDVETGEQEIRTEPVSTN